ncbi:YetF domain-containing protein [Ureibacillus sp. MALMAid1270]|uniref:YetF domain-containing protein n=1 Tax=Ureibacillus sp. MALMAid1270 TaxID=3411629 RepID=UPI003BA6B331
MSGFQELNIWEMIFRSTLSFFTILVLARIIGKKQLSQLTFFHYITGITIGSIAAEISTQVKSPFWDGFVSLIWWALLTLLMSYISLKSSTARVLIDDRPTILIQNGTIIKNGMKKARLHTDELSMLLREQGVFSFDEVLYAVFETNGELSVLKKPAKSAATKQDVKADCTLPKYMPTELISDGKIVMKNLIQLNLTEEWLHHKLKKKNVNNIEDVYFAQILENGSLYISLKNGNTVSGSGGG